MSKYEEMRALSKEASLDPQAGDYWNEMFCPYFLIIKVNPDKSMYVAVPYSKDATRTKYFSEDKVELISYSEFIKQISYSSGDLVTDVDRSEKYLKWAEDISLAYFHNPKNSHIVNYMTSE